MISKVEMERFTVISARPCDEVVATINTSIASYGNSDALKVAYDLDTKFEDLLRQPAA